MPFDHPRPSNTAQTHGEPESAFTKQLHQIYAGALAGIATRAATQPFDVLKIRFQLQVEPVSSTSRHRFAKSPTNAQGTSKYTSLMQAGRIILREEGLRAFWKGHNSGQVTSVTYGVAQFWTYEQLKEAMKTSNILQGHRYWIDFICGGLAGMTAACISTPFDVVRTRIVAADHGSGYNNMFHAFGSILRNEGIPGLFRGLSPTIIQIVPLVGFNFLFYGCLNDIAETILHRETGHLPAWWLLVSGGIAGATSKVLIYPLDFMKKRLQMRGFEKHRTTFGRTQYCRSLKDCVNLTIKDEGYLGFYKGLVPTLLKSGLTTALYFSVYDTVKELLDMPAKQPEKEPTKDTEKESKNDTESQSKKDTEKEPKKDTEKESQKKTEKESKKEPEKESKKEPENDPKTEAKKEPEKKSQKKPEKEREKDQKKD